MANGRPGLISTGGGARVIAPSPLISLAAVLSGLWLQDQWPLPVLTGEWPLVLGWSLVAVATVILLWSFYHFVRARTVINPYRSVRTLVAHGPYRYSRNPMYVSLLLFHAGYAFNNYNLWILLTLPPAMLLIRYGVIAREEAYLREKFGESYRRYQASVRRWI